MSDHAGTSSRGARGGSIPIQRTVRGAGVTDAQIRQAVRAALEESPFASVGIVLVDDAAIAQLHQRYMNDPEPTDVLTFDLRDDETGPIEGEIVISVETARDYARRFRAEPAHEVLRYVIHGVLHLRGYDDRTPAERARMKRAEARILKAVVSAGNGRKRSARRRAGR